MPGPAGQAAGLEGCIGVAAALIRLRWLPAAAPGEAKLMNSAWFQLTPAVVCAGVRVQTGTDVL